MNIAIGIMTVIPCAKSDSAIFFMLHRNDLLAKEYVMSLLLLREFSSDKQPSLWSKEVVEQSRDMLSNDLNANSGNENHSILRLPLYYYYFDKGQYSEALKILQPVSIANQKTLMSDLQSNIIFSLYVTHLCLFNRSLKLQSLSKINLIGYKEPYSYYRTIAAYKAFQQEYDEAKAALDQAKVFFHKGVKAYGYSHVEKHLLDHIEKEIIRKKAY
jgi:tetratricopeptide (TPR) repeat protein